MHLLSGKEKPFLIKFLYFLSLFGFMVCCMMLSLPLGSILSEVRRGVVELPGCVYTLSPLFFNWGTLTLTLTPKPALTLTLKLELTLTLTLALALEMALALLLLTISSTLKSLLVVFKACKMKTEREMFKSSTS